MTASDHANLDDGRPLIHFLHGQITPQGFNVGDGASVGKALLHQTPHRGGLGILRQGTLDLFEELTKAPSSDYLQRSNVYQRLAFAIQCMKVRR